MNIINAYAKIEHFSNKKKALLAKYHQEVDRVKFLSEKYDQQVAEIELVDPHKARFMLEQFQE
jgi:hypothetical protein